MSSWSTSRVASGSARFRSHSHPRHADVQLRRARSRSSRPPPPPPPPPAASAACRRRRRRPCSAPRDRTSCSSTGISRTSRRKRRRILDNAISGYHNCGNAQVMLAGHADRSGSASTTSVCRSVAPTRFVAICPRRGISGWLDLDRSVRRKPPARRDRRWCPRTAEPSRGNHLRPGFGHVSHAGSSELQGIGEVGKPASLFLCGACDGIG